MTQQKTYIIKIECPIENVGTMLYELTEEKMSFYMVYKDYWSLLNKMQENVGERYPSGAFKTKEDAGRFDDLCNDLFWHSVSSFHDGSVTIERDDSDCMVDLDDYVNTDLVRKDYLDTMLPWRRKDLEYISNWMDETIPGALDAKVGDIKCSVDAGPQTWGTAMKFTFKTCSERLARELNIVKAKFEVLEVNVE